MNSLELDEVVAKVVMGWSVQEERNESTGDVERLYYDGEQKVGNHGTFSFHPSTSLMDAGRLMDEVSIKNNWRIIIDYKKDYAEVAGKTPMGNDVGFSGIAKKLPLAIVLAVLQGYEIITWDEAELISIDLEGE